jgi:hypothetical protein
MCIQRPYLDNLHKLANSAEDLYNAGFISHFKLNRIIKKLTVLKKKYRKRFK